MGGNNFAKRDPPAYEAKFSLRPQGIAEGSIAWLKSDWYAFPFDLESVVKVLFVASTFSDSSVASSSVGAGEGLEAEGIGWACNSAESRLVAKRTNAAWGAA